MGFVQGTTLVVPFKRRGIRGFSPWGTHEVRNKCPAESPQKSALIRCTSTASGSRANPRKPSPSTIRPPKEVIAQVPDAGAEDVNRASLQPKPHSKTPMGNFNRAGTRPRPLRLSEKIRANLPRSPNWNAANTGKPSSKPIRHQRCRYLLRILRRPRHQSRWLRKPRSRQCHVSLAERASRRRRTQFIPWKLSTPHGRMETRARHCRGLHLVLSPPNRLRSRL